MQDSSTNKQDSGLPERELSDELENRKIKLKVEDPASGSAAGRTSDLKRTFMAEVGLEKYVELAETDEDIFNKLLELRIEQKRKEVEELRDSNLRTLNIVIGKCIESDKISDDIIRTLLDVVNLPHRGEPNPSSSLKRRKRNSPAMSPRGHRRIASEVASINTNQAQVQSMPSPYSILYHNVPGPTPWLPQHYNTPLQTQYQFQNSVPAGLGVRTGRSREASIVQNNENQKSDQFHSFSPANLVTTGNSGISGHHPGALSSRPSLMGVPTESPARGVSGYLQPPQQIQPHYGIKTDPIPQRRFASHQRSQSANFINGPQTHMAKSPINELHASPQKPINFLIHTPKHPPPS